ncbi:MAG: polysaccharide biosynthesis protein [Candidatus Eisenbacteria bacterium]
MGRRTRILLLNLLDALLINGAVLIALLLRFDGRIPVEYLHRYVEVSYFATIAGLLFLNLFHVHRTLWRYVGLPTALSILNALTLGFGVFYLVNLLIQPQPLPRSVIILSWILTIALVLGTRASYRLLVSPVRRGPRTGRRILIVGAGDIGAMVARELERTVAYPGHPIGFVDDDPGKMGARIEGLQVLGTTFDLPRLIHEKEVGEVLIAAPSAPGRLLRQVVRVCLESGIACRTVPALSDYIEGRGALDQVREVRIEDLLGREPISIDLPGIRQRIAGSVVLVTGAGGSIGSELCRQIARFAPARLVLLDHNENNLTYLGLELREAHPSLDVLHVVGDIKDEIGLHELLVELSPNLVFHAAAHKHVNLLETRPREAILNNILGTRNVARACEAAGVETMILISTDKAVNPTNVMGASKRACEMLLQALSSRSRTTFVAVRFGNVIGSEGSVLPIFRRQLARGGPLTVTHPHARRYFMTIPEASQLVIQAALLGQSGDIFILDMGEQVRILDVARQLIRLSGLEPDRDVRIDFVGLRPGEKLEEEILTKAETTRTTRHAKIFRCELDPVDTPRFEKEVEQLIRLAAHAPAGEIRAGLQLLVPEFREIPPPALPSLAPAEATEAESPLYSTASEPTGKRLLDVMAAATSLVLLAIPAAAAWGLLHLAGSGQVVFEAETRIGRNRRCADRRSQESRVGIDRRNADRRKKRLPGRPFVTYRLRLERSTSSSPLQRRFAAWIAAAHLDRVLYLWNVLRGDMSLVGPSAHLLESDVWRQEEIGAWTFARRPGLTGPAQLLAGGGEEVLVYDRYYGHHGNWQLDLDALRRALPRLLSEKRPAQRSPARPAVAAGAGSAGAGTLVRTSSGEEG